MPTSNYIDINHLEPYRNNLQQLDADIKAFSPEKKADFLKQMPTRVVVSALWNAAANRSTNHDDLASIFFIMKFLTEKQQAEILLAQEATDGTTSGKYNTFEYDSNIAGNNILMHAIDRNLGLGVVEQILMAIKLLPEEQQAELLMQKNHHKQDVIGMPAYHGLQAKKLIFSAVMEFSAVDVNIKYALLKEGIDAGLPEKMISNPGVVRDIWEGDLKVLLARLQSNLSKSTMEYDQRKSSINFYNKLQNDFDNYLSTPKNPSDVRELIHAWELNINDALAKEPIQSKSAFVEFLKTALLVLSVVGIFYLACQAGKNTTKNQSQFFIGEKGSILSQLQTRALDRTVGDGVVEDHDSEPEESPPGYQLKD